MSPEGLSGLADIRHNRHVTFQIRKDRAVGTMITDTAVGEVFKGSNHILHFADFSPQAFDL